MFDCMKKIFLIIAISFVFVPIFAQSDDDLFFDDDGIDEFLEVQDSRTEEINHGSLFETGSIKVGGNFETSLSTLTTIWADDDENFGTHLKNTTLTPKASAFLSVDARPTQTLRMYTKFGLSYPFKSSALATTNAVDIAGTPYYQTSVSISDYLKVKELFTDFSIKERAFFRFGLHTVTWGTGYFYSPVSDMINTSSINPEDVDEQVDGSLNLRTQIVFPGTQNCLWFYVIPSTNFNSSYSAESYLRETALASKADFVFGGWEIGVGGFYKYQNAPKVMLTASGSLKSLSIFGETVYQYGAASEWESAADDWNEKTNIFQATVGISRYWKTPSITLAAQYYYDGNDVDLTHQYVTQGHNIAFLANFGRIFGTTDVTANIFGMINIGKDPIPSGYKSYAQSLGINTSFLSSAIFSAMLNYNPINDLTLGLGPYITMESLKSKPIISLKFSATLGGGKF